MHDHVQLVVTFVPSFLLFRLTTRVYTSVLRTANKGKRCKKKKKKRGGGNDEVLMERVGDYY